MADINNLLQQRDSLRQKIGDTRGQFQQASIPITQDDATRYLNERVQGFQPLLEERRNLMSQATQALPSQIQQLTQVRESGQQTADPLTMLNSIMRNQANIRGTANLIGDQVDTARGRLGDIANSGLSQLGQKQNSLQYLLSQYANDENMLTGEIEAERAREEARRAREAAAALQQLAFQSQQDQLADLLGGGEPITIEEDASKNQVQGFQNMLNNASNAWNQNVSRPIAQGLYSAARGLKDRGVPGLGFVGNDRNITEDLLRSFGIRK